MAVTTVMDHYKSIPVFIELHFMVDKVKILVKNGRGDWEQQFIFKKTENFDSSQVKESIRKYLEYWGMWENIETNLEYSWKSKKEFAIQYVTDSDLPFDKLTVTSSFIEIIEINNGSKNITIIDYVYKSVWDQLFLDEEIVDMSDKFKKVLKFFGGSTGLINLKQKLRTIDQDILIYLNPRWFDYV